MYDSIRIVIPLAILAAVPLLRRLPRTTANWAAAALFAAVILWQAPVPGILMGGLGLLAWYSGRKRLTGWRLGLSAGLIASYLLVVKYVLVAYLGPFLIERVMPGSGLALVVPLGLSFLTFRLLDYVFLAAAGRLPAHRASDFALYVVFLPIFAAGPIQRFDRFLSGRTEQTFLDDLRFASGRLLIGLIKAFALPALLLGLAGYTGPQGVFTVLTDTLSAQPFWKVWATLWLMVMYFYLNFAGYSDLAIGAGRLLGFRIDENFDAPFLSRSLPEFWRRWHITLGDWCRNYVFLPVARMTGSPALAILATFLVIGLWHQGTLSWAMFGVVNGLAVLLSISVARRRWLDAVPDALRTAGGVLFVHLVACVAAAFSFSSNRDGVAGALQILARGLGLDGW